LQLEYELTKATAGEVIREVDRLCRELGRQGPMKMEAVQAGFDLTVSDAELISTSIRVEASGYGIDPSTVGIVVVLSAPFAKAGAKLTEVALKDIWRKIIFPRLEQRLGRGAIVEVRRGRKSSKSASRKKKR
jgi:hypothetical protein